MRKLIAITTFMLLLITSSYAQHQENSYKVNFAIGESEIDSNFGDNRESLEAMVKLLNAVAQNSNSELSDITIDGNTSPEGGATFNRKLSEARSNAIKDYLVANTSVKASQITSIGKGIAWDQLEAMVANSTMAERDEIIDIIKNIPEETYRKAPGAKWATLVDSRLKHLMEFKGGAPYRYMSQEFFPAMRNSGAVTIHYEGESVEEPIEIAKATTLATQTNINSQLAYQELPKAELTYTEPEEPITPENRKPIALKTNLLYDAAIAINLELEIPIKKKWSIMGEYIFPWWYNKSKNFTLRSNIAHVGVNYWLFNRTKRDQLEGWHLGIFGGYGSKYDIQQWEETGVQGSYLAAGVNIGFSHTLWRNLNLEYQLGAGWLQSDYKEYTMAYNTEYGDIKVHDYPWLTKRTNWTGPIQAEVSLVWIINLRRERGGESK